MSGLIDALHERDPDSDGTDPRSLMQPLGDLFDGTEIDEILQLRILTLTDEGSGTRITIVGEGFQAPVQVLFGSGTTGSFDGIEATVLETSPNRLVVLSPTASGFGAPSVVSTVRTRS